LKISGRHVFILQVGFNINWFVMGQHVKNEEPITDINMFQFIEKGMRGGTSYIAQIFGHAHNKSV